MKIIWEEKKKRKERIAKRRWKNRHENETIELFGNEINELIPISPKNNEKIRELTLKIIELENKLNIAMKKEVRNYRFMNLIFLLNEILNTITLFECNSHFNFICSFVYAFIPLIYQFTSKKFIHSFVFSLKFIFKHYHSYDY